MSKKIFEKELNKTHNERSNNILTIRAFNQNSNNKIETSIKKNQLLYKVKDMPIDIYNVNIPNTILKNFKTNLKRNKTPSTSIPSISANSTIIKITSKENNNELNKEIKNQFIEKTKMNENEFNKLKNDININFDNIQNLYLEYKNCCKDCILWIENLKNIYNEIIDMNKENEYFYLIKRILNLMLFFIIIIYDMSNQNKYKLFYDEIKNLFNICCLMGESIFNNSFNNPNINAKDEAQILIISDRDMNIRLNKIISQYIKINQKIAKDILMRFKKLKNENFIDLYDFFNQEIKNPSHTINKENNEEMIIQKTIIIYNTNLKPNNNNLENDLINTNRDNNNLDNYYKIQDENKKIEKVNTFIDNSNNYYYIRNPINFQKTQRVNHYQMLTDRLNNSNNNMFNISGPLNHHSLTPNINKRKNQIKSNNYNNNYLIQNDPRFKIIVQNDDSKIFSRYKNLKNNNNEIQKENNNNNKIKTINNNIPLSIDNYPNKNKKIKKESNLNYNNKNFLIPFPPEKPYTLVLDLDETLIHIPKGKKSFYSKSVIFRPGLIDFLRNLKEYYELIIFTTGLKNYADEVINFIEKDEKYFSYRLYRENAIIRNNNYYKDLSILGRDIKKIIIIDDTKEHILQEENCLIIKPFITQSEENNNDFILFDLILILIRIANEKPSDIRKSLKNYKNY